MADRLVVAALHSRDCRCNGCIGALGSGFPSEPIRYACRHPGMHSAACTCGDQVRAVERRAGPARVRARPTVGPGPLIMDTTADLLRFLAGVLDGSITADMINAAPGQTERENAAGTAHG